MNSLIFQSAAKFLLSITFVFSIWILFRGHNAPGGGFIGGLMAASGFSLYLLAYGAQALRQLIKIKIGLLMTLGLLCLLISGMMAVFQYLPFLTGIWYSMEFAQLKIGTPLIFDIGIYLVVLCSLLVMMLALEESI